MAQIRQLRQLADVMALRVLHAQTVLAGIAREEGALRKALSGLDRRSSSDDQSPLRGTVPSLAWVQAELRWQHWAEGRRRSIQSDLAQVLARKADARRALSRAVGKEAALAAIIRNLETKEQRAVQARHQLS